jgi:hypothetical protein
MFRFNPADYAEQFARDGYVHIKQGVTPEFFEKMKAQIEESMKTKLMKQFAIGDKQQAMYEFPDGGDYANELRAAVGAVTGLPAGEIVLSERHVKGYEADAAAEPNAHKDRFASQISVGLSVHVKEGSTLVLYPHDELEVNPFNASSLLRTALSTDRWPEARLKQCKRVEIKDSAGDVIMFRGHSTWHLRANPALTTMLYFKVNALNCDPLGEDTETPRIVAQSKANAELNDDQIAGLVPMIGRRVDYFHRHFDRYWQEIPGVVLFGEKHFTLDQHEWDFCRAIDGKKTVDQLARAASEKTPRSETLAGVRRMARRGVIDLMPARG